VNACRVAILEPYYGGSHAAFVDCVVAHSRHECIVAKLPARKWKWRMRGAALWLTHEGGDWMRGDRPVDVILANDMLAVADLKALLPAHLRHVPIVCYFHENQLTYPLSPDDWRDYQYGFTNVVSALAADEVWFNSRYHRDAFLSAADDLLRQMPDYVPTQLVESIRAKSHVFPPPVDVEPIRRQGKPDDEPPTILWCHRWEYDKNPGPFLAALESISRQGGAFRLMLLGERFRTAPPEFAAALDRLADHLRHVDYVPDRAAYLARVRECDFVVSTAIQENFGIAVVEAILSGCRPVLPNRLAYPELIPPELHAKCLFETDDALAGVLAGQLAGKMTLEADELNRLQEHLWSHCGAAKATASMDDRLADLAQSARKRD